MSLLQVQDLHVHYGGIAALRGVSLQVQAGETVAVIGANGAGKSSLLKAIARLIPAQGQLSFMGQDLTAFSAHQLKARGLALVPEGRAIFADMSVVENLQLGAYGRQDVAAVASDMEALCQRLPRLRERWRQRAGTLSGGEQQMLAMARALLGRPQLLLLDEPSMGLAPIMVQQIYSMIAEVQNQGVAILLVEQAARRALQICSQALVLEQGRVVLAGAGNELANDDRVRRVYLGGD